MTQIRM